MPPNTKYEARSQYLVRIISAELEVTNKLPRSSWTKVTTLFNAKYPGGFSQSLLRHHFNRLELHYDILQQFKDRVGFNLNEELGLVSAPVAVWRDHIKFHPEALMVRGHRFPMFQTMKALDLPNPPGHRAKAFHRELLKPKCDIQEAIQHYTTLMSHQEMLTEVLDGCSKGYNDCEGCSDNEDPEEAPMFLMSTASSTSTASPTASPISSTSRSTRSNTHSSHKQQTRKRPKSQLRKNHQQIQNKKKKPTFAIGNFSVINRALKLIETEGEYRIRSRVVRLRAPRVVRSEEASLLFLHLADDIRWDWLVDEAEHSRYDSRLI